MPLWGHYPPRIFKRFSKFFRYIYGQILCASNEITGVVYTNFFLVSSILQKNIDFQNRMG